MRGPRLYGALTVVLCVLFSTSGCAVKTSADLSRDADVAFLTVALYPYVPRLEQFQTALRNAWQDEAPGVALKFEDWDCYDEDPPANLDVFVFDAVFFDHFRTAGYLSQIEPDEILDRDDFLSYALDGCQVGSQYFAIPQLGCGSALFYRKTDEALAAAVTLDEVVEAVGECVYKTEVPPKGEGLLVDLSGGVTSACLYLDALEQNYGRYTPNPPLAPEPPKIDAWAIQNVQRLIRMASPAQAAYYSEEHPYQRAAWFSEGAGRAMIGYTESMSVMSAETRAQIAFKLMPLASRKDARVSLFYSDVIGVNAGIRDPGKRALALKLANLMASAPFMIESIGPTETAAVPQYLMPVRHSVFKAMSASYPLYGEMYRMVADGRPGLFRIGPDARAWLEKLKGEIKSQIYAGACQ